MGFVHLHLHTQYSLLDGANKIGNLIPRVKDLGMPAVAMTDHGNMFGAVEFYQKAREAGVQPILGCEMYVAPASRFEKKLVRSDDYEAGGNFHLILLATDEEGYRNLCRLVSLGFKEGFYYKPRIDKELLREFNRGLIALSGCLSGEVNQAIQAGSMDRARSIMEDYRSIFGDRYYVEIQDNHLPQQERCNVELIRLARELSLPLVATNDCHYLEEDDAEAHEVLLCIQTGKTMADEKRFKLDTHELYVKSPEQMRQAFAHCPEAVDNTLDIARRCTFEMKMRDYKFPAFQTKNEESLEAALDRETRAGLEERLKPLREKADWTPEKEKGYRERLELELEMIKQMGFAGYFLIVADFTNYAKSKSIPVGPGRGSAAGSLVAYALRITDLDPIPYNLLFERFLNPERVSMPDIDMDFCFERRDEVIRYVREKYGEDRVAQIITFGTLKGKAAIKDVGRALGFNYTETDKIAKLYPAPKQGKDFELTKALEMEPRLRDLRDSGEREQKLFGYALRLEGLLRHASKHAAGIVISAGPLVDHLPLFVDKEGSVMTQYDGRYVDEIGLIKFDFLGLKTLTMLDSIVRRVKAGREIEVDLSRLPLDDKGTYRLLAKGDAVGVFQMESGGMRKLLTQLRPTTFEEIIAVLALYRPGPLDSGMVEEYIKRKHGKVEVKYPHPAVKKVLQETYGVIVYQEQVMQIAQVLAGYSLGDADLLRRAMGKKDPQKMKKERERFIAGAVKNGVQEELAGAIFDQMETFAAYGFNKSHSAAYALVSYHTAYLKAHYPEEFMAGLMTLEMDDTDKTYKNMAECRERGIRILPPDVNESYADFTVVPDPGKEGKRAIRFGLAAVKGVGGKAVEAVIEARRRGPFQSLAEFCQRVLAQVVNKRVLESLITCGAFDFTGRARRSLMEGLDRTMQWAQAHARDASSGQIGLFGSGSTDLINPEPNLPDVPEWKSKEFLKAERDSIGFFISGHPLDKYAKDLKRFTDASTATLPLKQNSEKVRLGGVIHSLKLKNSKKGDRYGVFFLEDLEGAVEVIAWPETFRKCEAAIQSDDPVVVRGSVEISEERCQVIADEIGPLTAARESAVKQVHIALRHDRVDEEKMVSLRQTLSEHRGACPTFLHLLLPTQVETVIALPDELKVAPTEGMVEAVERLFGSGVTTFQ